MQGTDFQASDNATDINDSPVMPIGDPRGQEKRTPLSALGPRALGEATIVFQMIPVLNSQLQGRKILL